MDHVHDAVYMAHGYCLLWKPWLVGTHLATDLAIFVAYTAIPIAILAFLHKRQFEQKHFTYLGYWFASFIFLCGVTHLIQIFTLWYPVYEFQAYVKVLTAVVSLITVVIMIPLIVKALAIPTPSEYEAALVKLEEANDTLEARVEEKTRECKTVMYEMAHRVKNLLAVVHGILVMSKPANAPDIESFLANFEGRLMCLSTSVEMLINNKWRATSIHTVIKEQLNAFKILEAATITGPDIQLTPSQVQYLSLALYELATNSTKFEVKVGVGSRYRITWHSDGKDFKFIWHEENSRPINPPKTEGFGSRLLKQIVPHAFTDGKAVLLFGQYYVNYILEANLKGVR